ncbi:hypothetical protein ACLOJK_003999 [Asimina triloba]
MKSLTMSMRCYWPSGTLSMSGRRLLRRLLACGCYSLRLRLPSADYLNKVSMLGVRPWKPVGRHWSFSAKLKAIKAKVALLREQVVDLDAREAKSLAELKATKAEVALLREQVISLGIREVELLAELKVLRGKMARLRAVQSKGA